MKEIALSRGLVALVDDEDFVELSKYKWYANPVGARIYARRDVVIDGKRIRIYMHKMILRTDNLVDHINGNGLDNRKTNLRSANFQLNGANRHTKRKRYSGVPSKYHGVCWHKAARKWMSAITVKYERIYLGLFESEEDAARAYNKEATKQFGQFATLNPV